MKTILRNWTEKDIPALAEIERQSFKTPWTENMLMQEFGNKFFNCIVAETEGVLTGFLNYHVIGDEYHIANIAVKESFKRQGIATQLITAILETAIRQKIYGITLEVRQSNCIAIAMYEKFGFKTEGKRVKYYINEDALIMWKYL